MRKLFLTFALAIVALGAAGCRKQAKLPECQPLCEKLSAELKCERTHKCKEECEDLAKRTVCRKELDVFAACFLVQPKEQWECDEEGKPAPKLTVCVNERNTVSACMEREYRRPGVPPASGGH
jgi:hypothetical protein